MDKWGMSGAPAPHGAPKLRTLGCFNTYKCESLLNKMRHRQAEKI